MRPPRSSGGGSRPPNARLGVALAGGLLRPWLLAGTQAPAAGDSRGSVAAAAPSPDVADHFETLDLTATVAPEAAFRKLQKAAATAETGFVGVIVGLRVRCTPEGVRGRCPSRLKARVAPVVGSLTLGRSTTQSPRA